MTNTSDNKSKSLLAEVSKPLLAAAAAFLTMFGWHYHHTHYAEISGNSYFHIQTVLEDNHSAQLPHLIITALEDDVIRSAEAREIFDDQLKHKGFLQFPLVREDLDSDTEKEKLMGMLRAKGLQLLNDTPNS